MQYSKGQGLPTARWLAARQNPGSGHRFASAGSDTRPIEMLALDAAATAPEDVTEKEATFVAASQPNLQLWQDRVAIHSLSKLSA